MSPFPTLNGTPPLVIAHRGASGYLPEHTLEAYARAAELGADYIEPDLVATRDGVLIARHEPNLTDTTNVAAYPEFAARKKTVKVDGRAEEGWFAADFTLAEIRTLRAVQARAERPQAFNGRFLIPTLAEILALRERLARETGREIGVYPETKHPSWHAEHGLPLETRLVALLQEYGLDRPDAPVFIQSFETANLKALGALTPVKKVLLIDGDTVTPDGRVVSGRPYDFVLSGDARRFADLMTPEGLAEIRRFADAIGPWKAYIVPALKTSAGDTLLAPTSLVGDAHAAGLMVHPFTFRNEASGLAADYHGDARAEYRLFYSLGVDGVFSDFSDTAVAVRDELLGAAGPR
ncbi:glycerophosphodiester phosphodiesterase [Crenobacter cavernae]|uniref:glycerophosphodiester phosphodiesterase n=1 Tax=Crenobacter cavernae TaxID=2290923 RepID=A0A345Y4B7_9NEIS|nr:glycerophosphodiester phosphodiesterase [Crenobacter cavernae]AXK38769.1 glycerophosphodiester phosphodiesterase [Crenobacter cavernae]